MARGRMIAKTFSTSEKRAALHRVAGKLAEFCQALFPLLVAHSDDSGRQQGDTFTVKHAVDPTSPRPLVDFDKALAALASVGLIHWYEVDGRRYIEIVQFADHQPGLKNRGNSKIPEMPPNAAGCRDVPLEGKGRELKGSEGKGTDPGPLAMIPDESDPAAPECKVEAIVQLWNGLVEGTAIAAIRGLSDTRRQHIRARLKDHGLGVIHETFKKAAASTFLRGDNKRKWVVTFDWIMASPTNFLKVTEGQYDNREQGAGGPSWAERKAAEQKKNTA